MKTKLLTSAILLAVTSTAAHAVSINMRHEWTPEFEGNDQVHKDRIAVSHRFANGVGFEVEAKYKSGDGFFDFDQFVDAGNQANISYKMKLGNGFDLTPQYKIENDSSSHNHQLNLTLGYKINDDWSTSFRHRYNYKLKNGEYDSHYNRWTVGLGYKGIEDWSLSGSTDYTFKEEGDESWKGNKNGFTEINFKAEYKWGNGWSPFAEFGVTPEKKEGSSEKDTWKPRYRVGMKYSF
ncbi:oligogalacturonate-specific porin [Vibrio xiamenensis]|uniref:Oligogalacturonate-specific porin n=1 Tax=Vibrio xiamenensis TaxID=861298 RepID=A0A1G7XGE0_9VIBR|nr:oligogalacturonate-specific porin KdgM family protein [Vibrio xiamenensis]SDG83184.1 oligogalacturonate-specific porin [Vibrio xiamenensis]